MKKTILIIASAIMLGACGNSNFDKSEESKGLFASYETNNAPAPPPVSEIAAGVTADIVTMAGEKQANQKYKEVSNKDGTITTKIPAKIRKNAYLNIAVDDYKKARAAIEKIVKSGNAYIASENEQNSTYSMTNDMVIRVVNKDFEGMVNNVTGIASHVNSKNITADDVTAQFIDIETRLKSKKEIEKRYLDILSKASKVTDILEIEQKLGEIREEIEAKEGELKLLADQVDYSTINLTFTQNFEYTPIDRPGFLGRTGNAFENGWEGFLNFIIGLVYVWPLWLIIGVSSFFLLRFIRRKIRNKKI